MRIAVIITAFNRKEKTLSCLERLYKGLSEQVNITVYLTDDGSTDGTYDAVSECFPEVIISEGDGTLFWGGGMNLSWKRAVEDGGYDGYLWLNDDTELFDNIWSELVEADSYCRKTFKTGGIYVGSTKDRHSGNLTYGGSVNVSKWRSLFKKLKPNGTFQQCEIANGNITYVSHDVVKRIGCLYHGYKHGADYDYTYWANKEGFPILILRDYMGFCENDHKSLRENLLKRTIKERIKYLYAPTGMQLDTALLFQKRFVPHYVPLLYISYWTKALFPWILRTK